MKEGRDLGSAVITELLEKLQPRTAFFGHHHYEFEGRLGKTRIIGLGYPKRSYVTATVDGISGDLRFDRHRSKLVEKGKTRVYQYAWEREEDTHEERDRERLFSMVMPTLMSREESIAEMLDKRFRDKLKEHLLPVFLPRVGNEGDTERTRRLLAEGLANGVFNTVLPYFARYYMSLKASLSMKEKGLLKKGTLQQMLKDKASISFAQDDLMLAFNVLSEFVDQD